jgi:hypothetical protein
MSNLHNQNLLENLFDQFYTELLERGYSESEATLRAEAIAYERLEEYD